MTTRDSQIVIVAGGEGTRLRTVLGDMPKLLAPVGGEPFLAALVDNLSRQGFRRVHLCLGRGADAILSEISGRRYASIEWTSSVERSPMGVIGALADSRPYLDDKFVLLYGDVYPSDRLSSLVEAFDYSRMDAMMSTFRNCGDREPSNVRVINGLIEAYEKHNADPGAKHVDIGMIVLKRALLPPSGYTSEEQFYPAIAASGRFFAFECDRVNLHIGTTYDYLKFFERFQLPESEW